MISPEARHSKLTTLHHILKKKYGDNNLGNQKDPLDELIFIMLTVKTDYRHYSTLWKSLKKSFHNWDDLLKTSEEEIASKILVGGLQRQKSSRLKRTLLSIRMKVGKTDLSFLHDLSDKETEEFLMSLDGVGKKIARCVMMYSLGRSVFPVDSNVIRISERVGLIDSRTRNADDRLQDFIPNDIRYSLHVNMVALGREICLDRKPKCSSCPVKQICDYGIAV